MEASAASGLIDDPVEFRVDPACAGEPARLVLSVRDAGGRLWSSATEARVDADGALRCVGGAGAPWWDMRPDDGGPGAFAASLGSLRYEARATVGRAPATTEETIELTRTWGTATPSGSLEGDGWRLELRLPAGTPAGGVLLVPGTTGAARLAPLAALLASRGYATAVFERLDAPAGSFSRVPVETLRDAIDRFAERVAPRAVVVLAYSFGTTLALAAAAADEDGASPAPPLAGLVAVAPTSVVWQAVAEGPPARHSSLTRAGRDIPYLAIRGEALLPQVVLGRLLDRLARRPARALRLLPAYEPAFARMRPDDPAILPAERIPCPLLVVAGAADAMWPSEAMGRALVARRGRREDRLLVLPGAGHFLRLPNTPTTADGDGALVSGGTPEGTARAQRESWDAILAALASWCPAASG